MAGQWSAMPDIKRSFIKPKVLFWHKSKAASGTQDVLASQAVLTEATRQVDIIHTSFAGAASIVMMLLIAVALPIFGYAPVHAVRAFSIIVFFSLAGVAYLY